MQVHIPYQIGFNIIGDDSGFMPTDGTGTLPTFQYTVSVSTPLCIHSHSSLANLKGSTVGKPATAHRAWSSLSTLQPQGPSASQTTSRWLWQVVHLRSLQLPPHPRPSLCTRLRLHQPRLLQRTAQEQTSAPMDNVNVSAILT